METCFEASTAGQASLPATHEDSTALAPSDAGSRPRAVNHRRIVSAISLDDDDEDDDDEDDDEDDDDHDTSLQLMTGLIARCAHRPSVERW